MTNDHYVNPFDDEGQEFLALTNAAGQFSLWPCFAALPDPLARALARLAEGCGVSVADLAMAGIAVYLHRLSGDPRPVVGVPFLRRMGSAAVHSVAPVVSVLPARIDLTGADTLAAAAGQVRAALKEARRHQRYDAERIPRDLGQVGSGKALYGPVVNYRMFDYDLDFAGVEAVTHHLATGPVDDFEFGLMTRGGGITLELRADRTRYGTDELVRRSRLRRPGVSGGPGAGDPGRGAGPSGRRDAAGHGAGVRRNPHQLRGAVGDRFAAGTAADRARRRPRRRGGGGDPALRRRGGRHAGRAGERRHPSAAGPRLSHRAAGDDVRGRRAVLRADLGSGGRAAARRAGGAVPGRCGPAGRLRRPARHAHRGDGAQGTPDARPCRHHHLHLRLHRAAEGRDEHPRRASEPAAVPHGDGLRPGAGGRPAAPRHPRAAGGAHPFLRLRFLLAANLLDAAGAGASHLRRGDAARRPCAGAGPAHRRHGPAALLLRADAGLQTDGTGTPSSGADPDRRRSDLPRPVDGAARLPGPDGGEPLRPDREHGGHAARARDGGRGGRALHRRGRSGGGLCGPSGADRPALRRRSLRHGRAALPHRRSGALDRRRADRLHRARRSTRSRSVATASKSRRWRPPCTACPACPARWWWRRR